jgi:hypothetical protein
MNRFSKVTQFVTLVEQISALPPRSIRFLQNCFSDNFGKGMKQYELPLREAEGFGDPS